MTTLAFPLVAMLLALSASGNAGEQLLVGYLPQWGVYGRDYTVRSVERSGAAERLDVLIYAFAAIGPDLRATLTDPHADLRMAYNAAGSVDGKADDVGAGILRGSFNQLRKLKARHPQLKVVLAIGGWSGSEHFSDAALSTESRRVFATSCIDLAIGGAFAPDLNAPGVFDGIDIDWEFPGAPGASKRFRAEDGANFTALLVELRAQLDRRGAVDGRRYLLSAALPAAQALYAHIELGRIHPPLDHINLMAYDFAGAWDRRTGHLAALFADAPADCVDRAVRDHLAAGIPAAKLMLGVPFYGRGWNGVEPGARGDGMGQAASGPAVGPNAPGADDVRSLASLPASFTAFHDTVRGAAWRYDPALRMLWSYDDPVVLRQKRDYATMMGLGGMMAWELSGDDAAGSLIRTLKQAPVRSGDRP